MIERDMQELIWRYPDRLLNEPLKQFAWETSSEVGRADLVFEDRHGRLLIVEVKRGKLPRGAIDQLLDYFGMMKEKFPEKPVELMVVANVIPSQRRLTCESRDIECREISEKIFRDLAAEIGYRFTSEQGLSIESPEHQSTIPNPSEARTSGSNWVFNKGVPSSADKQDFLSRCDEQGTAFFSALFAAVGTEKHVKLTWKHESGFSLQFYFPKLGFAPVIWGFPSRNRQGRCIRQRLDFPFDFSIKAGVGEPFINDFATAISFFLPFTASSKRPSIAVSGVITQEQTGQVIATILDFAARGSKLS